MAKFSKRSMAQLQTCDERLQTLFNEIIKHYDCTIICGHRDIQAQNNAYHSGMSQLPWPQSKHNKYPSLAVDVMPYPIDWDDHIRCYHFIGFVLGVASQMGIAVRSGSDWNMNNDLYDQSFFDLPHFELID